MSAPFLPPALVAAAYVTGELAEELMTTLSAVRAPAITAAGTGGVVAAAAVAVAVAAALTLAGIAVLAARRALMERHRST